MTNSKSPLLKIENLKVKYSGKTAVNGVTFEISAGERVAIVGESGSGKTTIVNSIISVLPETAKIEGKIEYSGERVGYVGQDPNTNLNPVLKIGTQIADVLSNNTQRVKHNGPEVIDLLESAGLKNAKALSSKYPHEFSGGMKQRALISLGMAKNPQLLVADEPTSALDASIANDVLDFIETKVRNSQTALLFVTHDLSLAANHSDKIIVMNNGEIVEYGETSQILKSPKNEYTKTLLKASVSDFKTNLNGAFGADKSKNEVLYSAENLTKTFTTKTGETTALNDVSFSLQKGITTVIVGESGSGKSTLVNILLGLIAPTSGTVYFEGEDLTKFLGGKNADKILRDNYIHRVSAVFQNPYSSLDPTYSVKRIVEEPMLIHKQRLTEFRSEEYRIKRIRDVLEQVGCLDLIDRHPATLSGGQRQRVAIARSLVLRPDVIFFDEAVSALDVLVGAQIVDLINQIQREMSLTAVFITHDMNVAKRIADTVIVMDKGRIIDQGNPKDLLK